MPAEATSFSLIHRRGVYAAKNIFFEGNNFHVGGVNASAIAAQMVDKFPRRDFLD
jgi:hypothetical protein